MSSPRTEGKTAGRAATLPKSLGQGLRDFRISPLVAVLALLLGLMVIPPLIYLAKTSLYTTTFVGAFDEFTLQHYAKMLTNPDFFRDFGNTMVYAIGSSVVAICLGTMIAWIVERTNAPFRRYMVLVSVVSLGTPHVLYTISWILVLGKAGPINLALMALTGAESTLISPYSMHGMVLIEGLSYTPLAYLLLSAVLRSTDPNLEEASFMSGANVRESFRFITLPLCTPAILALLLLIFIRAFESFEVPMLVGMPGGVSVLATEIYDSISSEVPPDFGQSGAFSVTLLIVVMLFLKGYGKLSRNAERYQTITARGFRPRLIDLGPWRHFAGAVLVAFVVLLIVLPIGIVIWISLLPYYDGFSIASLQRVTFDNFDLVLGSPSFRESILNTIMLGAGTATLTTIAAALCGWLVVRRFSGAWALDQLATLPVVFPAIVLGVAYLQIFVNTPFGFYGSLFSLILASATLYLPYGMRYSCAGAMQIHTELEQAARVAGAGNMTTFCRIVLPLLFPAVMTAWLLIFLMSVRAVSLPLLLAGPNSQVVAVSLFDLWNNGQINEVAAMGVSWSALMCAVSLVLVAVSSKFGLTFR